MGATTGAEETTTWTHKRGLIIQCRGLDRLCRGFYMQCRGVTTGDGRGLVLVDDGVADPQAVPSGRGLTKWFPEDVGMMPRRLHSESASSHAARQFDVRDIEGARSIPKNRLVRRIRNTNPLCPAYKLPNASYHEPESPLPKFLRDTLDTLDIAGTKVRTAIHHCRGHGGHQAASGWGFSNSESMRETHRGREGELECQTQRGREGERQSGGGQSALRTVSTVLN
jgi:hypothetical protein